MIERGEPHLALSMLSSAKRTASQGYSPALRVTGGAGVSDGLGAERDPPSYIAEDERLPKAYLKVHSKGIVGSQVILRTSVYGRSSAGA